MRHMRLSARGPSFKQEVVLEYLEDVHEIFSPFIHNAAAAPQLALLLPLALEGHFA